MLPRGMMSQTNIAATAARQATGDEPVPPPAEIAAKHPAMRAVESFAEALIVLALLGELLLVLANVFARVYLQRSFLWSDEVARLSLSILAFIGGAVAYRRRDHAFVRGLLDRAAPALELEVVADFAASVKKLPISKLQRRPVSGEVRELSGNWKQHAWNYMDKFHITFIHRSPGGLADAIDVNS